jgi:serine/threonine protein kinase
MLCCTAHFQVFEYCSRGSLEDWLVGRKSFTRGAQLTWQQRLQVAHQVATALQHLHSQPDPIIHRDIKPNNILITQEPACCCSSSSSRSSGCGCSCSCRKLGGQVQQELQAGSDGATGRSSSSSSSSCSCGWRLSARLADVGLSRFLPVNLTSVQSSSSTPGCFWYLPDEYNMCECHIDGTM